MLKHDLVAIVTEYVAGDSLARIGDRRGVTREAVRRVLMSLADYSALRERHDAAVARRRPERRDPRERRRWHGVAVRRSTRRFSDDDLLAALRDWRARHGDPVSVYRWNAVRDSDFPSAPLITERLGGWNAAKAAAGLSIEPERRRYATRWSRAELPDFALAYLRTLGDVANASWDGYTRWAAAPGQRGRVPSGHSLRKLGGTWSAVLKSALYRYHAEVATACKS